MLAAMLSGALLSSGTAETAPAESAKRSVTVYTRVTKWGQMPERFTVGGQEILEDVRPGDFIITGEAAGWGMQQTHPFTCGAREIIREEDGWSLIPEQFPDKYFYVRSMTAECAAHPELSFSTEDITETLTETADRFTLTESDNHMIKAQVFRAEGAGAAPVVIVFHGYGDTSNLLTYRTAVDWAEPENQRKRPCTVIAPVIEDGLYTSDAARSRIFAQIMEWTDRMIADGTADPDRIYLMGNSFGGMSAIEMAEQYPDRIAAVMALCPALNYSRTGLAAIGKMKNVPLYIAQAENDETIPSSVGKQAAEKLAEAGGDVTLRIFSDAEMEACGARFGQEQTYSFHHVELALLENDEYAGWLFERKLSDRK